MADAQLNTLWRSCDRALLAIEREVSLLVRCCPTNAVSEQQRLLSAWQAGAPQCPSWQYPTLSALDDAPETLQRLTRALPKDAISELYRQRVEELDLERQMATRVGTPELRALATRRYQFTAAQSVGAADALAEEWSRLDATALTEVAVSDDPDNPQSLYASMCRVVGELRLPFRVVLSDSLTAAAATGESLIAVARGRRLGAKRTRRIVVHEVFGHALPRLRAGALPLGLFQVGSSFGNDVQEGWALEKEVEHGLMDDERRRELGLRHVAANSVVSGADWVETTRLLLQRGAQLAEASELSNRAHRGGGLARERVYLAAWCQVREALSSHPELESYLGSGRLSVEAATTLTRERASWQA